MTALLGIVASDTALCHPAMIWLGGDGYDKGRNGGPHRIRHPAGLPSLPEKESKLQSVGSNIQ